MNSEASNNCTLTLEDEPNVDCDVHKDQSEGAF